MKNFLRLVVSNAGFGEKVTKVTHSSTTATNIRKDMAVDQELMDVLENEGWCLAGVSSGGPHSSGGVTEILYFQREAQLS